MNALESMARLKLKFFVTVGWPYINIDRLNTLLVDKLWCYPPPQVGQGYVVSAGCEYKGESLARKEKWIPMSMSHVILAACFIIFVFRLTAGGFIHGKAREMRILDSVILAFCWVIVTKLLRCLYLIEVIPCILVTQTTRFVEYQFCHLLTERCSNLLRTENEAFFLQQVFFLLQSFLLVKDCLVLFSINSDVSYNSVIMLMARNETFILN